MKVETAWVSPPQAICGLDHLGSYYWNRPTKLPANIHQPDVRQAVVGRGKGFVISI